MKPVLQYPKIQKLYTLSTDASHYAYYGVHTQELGVADDLRPIAYTSGLFSEMQQCGL